MVEGFPLPLASSAAVAGGGEVFHLADRGFQLIQMVQESTRQCLDC